MFIAVTVNQKMLDIDLKYKTEASLVNGKKQKVCRDQEKFQKA